MMMFHWAKNSRMGTRNLLRYAWSDLRARPGTTGLTLTAVAVGGIYTLLLGFYASAIYRYQRSFLDGSALTEIVAATPDATNRDMRFTPERLGNLASIPGIARAFPRVELNVLLVNGDRTATVPAEGTPLDDPRLREDRLSWGRGPFGIDTTEVVLSQSLFEKLGGHVVGGPEPNTITLEVSRTIGGRIETQRVALIVTGLMRSQRMEKAYIPIDLAERLDLWCTARIQSLSRGAESTAALLTYAWADAWVPVLEEARVADEIDRLGVTASKVGEVSVITSRGRVWTSVSRTDGGSIREGDLRLIESFGMHAQRVELTRWGQSSVAVLEDADPRWHEGGNSQAMGLGTAISTNGRTAGVSGDIVVHKADHEWAVGADLVCSLPTAQWAAFDADVCDGAESVWVIETQDLWAAAQIAALHEGDRWAVDRETVRLFLVPPIEMLADTTAGPPNDLPLYWEGELDAESFNTPGIARLRIRFVPDSIFIAMVGKQLPTLAAEEPPVLLFSRCRWGPLPHRLISAAGPMRVIATEEAAIDMLVVPESERLRLCPDALQAGRVAHGHWEMVAEPALRLVQAGWNTAAGTLVPHSLTAFISAKGRELPAELVPLAGHVTVRNVPGITVREDGGERAWLLVGPGALAKERAPDERIWIGESRQGGARLKLCKRAWTSPFLTTAQDRRLPAGVAMASSKILRSALFHSSEHKPLSSSETRFDIPFDDTLKYATATRGLAAHGLQLVPLVSLATERLVHYELRETGDEGFVRDDLVAVLAMSRPTFVAARGHLTIPTRKSDGPEITLTASDHLDPIRFDGNLSSGRWLAGEAVAEVILPRSVKPGRGVERVVLRFERRTDTAAPESIELEFALVGQSAGEVGYMPRVLAAQIELWRRGRLVFNETRAAFMSPLEIALQGGHVRCNVFAESAEAVPAVVQALRQMGYVTEDRLAEYDGLRRLGKILVFLVAFFVLGCLSNAAISVFSSTALHVKNKTWEIGILLAHGVRLRDAWGVFIVEGLGIGLTAFAFTSIVIAVVEPGLRGLICQTFALDAARMLPGSPFDVASIWLPGLTLVICVFFSVVGAALPAWRACRLKPIDALRRRE